MRQQDHSNSSISISSRDEDIKTGPASGATSRQLGQIAAGALLFVAGTALGAFFAALPFRGRVPLGISFPTDFLQLPGIGSLTFYACLLSSPLFVWLARRYPIYQRHWGRNLAIHFLITAALILLTGVIYFRLMIRQVSSLPPRTDRTASQASPATAVSSEKSANTQSRRAAPGGFRLPDLKGFLLMRLFNESLPFWAMIALIHAFEFRRRYRMREVEAARLQAQLAESRLEALTAQLHPHFLFNTLQGISTLMHRDVKAADAMLSRLSDLLRQTLQRGERQEVALSEELEMLDHYVGIARERFKDRLSFEVHIPADVRTALVPFFILQPLVENALQHGIARRSGTGRVSVSAAQQDGMLHLSVTDDGPGLAGEDPGLAGEDPGLAGEERAFPREGIGLSNTRQRLRQLYGDEQSLTIETPHEGGLRVELVIPYRTAPGSIDSQCLATEHMEDAEKTR